MKLIDHLIKDMILIEFFRWFFTSTGAQGSTQETARVVQLVTDSVQDLEAVEQQAGAKGWCHGCLNGPKGVGTWRILGVVP
jgi:hypothetical protein